MKLLILLALIGLSVATSPVQYYYGPINPCAGNPCGDPQATCHKTGTTINSFRCTCPSGMKYSETYYACEAPFNPCAQNPCGDPRAKCVATGNGMNDFKCTCPRGEKFDYNYGCQAPYNPCSESHCAQGAKCVATGKQFGNYKCVCPSGTKLNYFQHRCVAIPKPKPKPKPKPSGPRRGQYLGCYRDRASRDLNGPKKWWNGLTPTACVNFCYSRGQKYAGVQFYYQCFCANRYGTYGRANNCNLKCRGNRRKICGGAWANNVYATGRGGGNNRPAPRPRRRRGQYLGCYRDRGSRDLNGPKKWWNGNTPSRCVNFCYGRGQKYAGVQYSYQCFCANRYGTYGRANNCNMRCRGNRGKICGGTWANNVYATGR